MPIIKIKNCNSYHYEIHGSGEETIVWSHGLLFNGSLFYKQIDYFKSKYTIIVYDHRGHGQSEATKSEYDMDSLYEDTVQLLEHLKLKKVHFGGLGGFVAMRLAARRPDLVKSLVLMGPSASAEPNVVKYRLINNVAKFSGIKAVIEPTLNYLFGDNFLIDPNNKNESDKWTEELLKNNDTIYLATAGFINRKPVEDRELEKISCPTLILVGTQDKITTPDKGEYIHSKIENSTLKYIEGAGHMACIEEPEKYNDEIEQFLNQFNS